VELILGPTTTRRSTSSTAKTGRGVPPIGVGEDSVIAGAILDKNARIGGACASQEAVSRRRTGRYYIREGIVLVPRTASFRRMVNLERRRHFFRCGRLDLAVPVGDDALAIAAVFAPALRALRLEDANL